MSDFPNTPKDFLFAANAIEVDEDRRVSITVNKKDAPPTTGNCDHPAVSWRAGACWCDYCGEPTPPCDHPPEAQSSHGIDEWCARCGEMLDR